MCQEALHAKHSTPGSSPLANSSHRDRLTATIIREEAAESLLSGIQGDAELAALNRVLNRYRAAWWVQHLGRVGADPETYWRAQLGAEIEAATRGKQSTSQRKKFPWWFPGWFTMRATYKLCDLDLDPL